MFEKLGPCKVLIWFATNRCNIRCIHCCAGSVGEASGNELTTEEAKMMVKEVVKLGIKYLGIVGGEPLLREDILEIIDYANSLSLSSHVVTKGTLLDEKWVEELYRRKALISIALDAFNPKTYDWITQVEGTYQKAIRAIELCRNKGILQGITATLLKNNAKEIFDLLNFSIEMKMERCPVFVLRPIGRGVEVWKDLALKGREYENFLHKLYHEIEKVEEKIDFFIYDPIYYRILYQHKRNKLIKEYYPHKKLCGLGRYLNIDSEGNVLACLFTDLKVGSIREKSLEEIWKDVMVSEFFRAIHSPKNLKGACRRCKYNEICGGCRSRAYKLTGDWFASDPACYYSQLNPYLRP
jgi:radical SAM protein with 4Fe4S-binding SPASM domain